MFVCYCSWRNRQHGLQSAGQTARQVSSNWQANWSGQSHFHTSAKSVCSCMYLAWDVPAWNWERKWNNLAKDSLFSTFNTKADFNRSKVCHLGLLSSIHSRPCTDTTVWLLHSGRFLRKPRTYTMPLSSPPSTAWLLWPSLGLLDARVWHNTGLTLTMVWRTMGWRRWIFGMEEWYWRASCLCYQLLDLVI